MHISQLLDPCETNCETTDIEQTFSELEPATTYLFNVSVKSEHLEITTEGDVTEDSYWGSKPTLEICKTKPSKITGKQSKNLKTSRYI